MPVKIKGAPGGEGGDAPGGSGGTWRRLYLVRHGEVAYFCADGRPADPWEVSLNANGKAQADRFATALSGCGAELLMTSAVPRAIQTAAILAAGMNLTPVVDACWHELQPCDLAAFPPARLHGVIVDAYRRAAEPGACFFGGEGFADFARRAGDALEHLLTSRSWSTAVVVTHDPVLRFLVARCLGLGLGGIRFFEHEPGCINVIEFENSADQAGEPLIRLMNGAPGDLARLAGRGPVLDRFYQRYTAAQRA